MDRPPLTPLLDPELISKRWKLAPRNPEPPTRPLSRRLSAVRSTARQVWQLWRQRGARAAARAGRASKTPQAQLFAAIGGMLGGGALIGTWCVGLLLIIGGLLVAGDALLRNSDTETESRMINSHEEVIERYRRAR